MKSFASVLLPVVLFASIVAAASPQDSDYGRKKKHDNVPDGGSAAIYLVLGATACLGAMAIRRKERN